MAGKKRTKDAAVQVKHTEALRLRVQGMSLDDIAAHLGYANASGAYKAIESELAAVREPAVEEYRKVQNMQLDQLSQDLYSIGSTVDDPETEMKIIDRKIKVMERRAKLNGMDAPVKTDVTSGGEPLTVVVHRDWDDPEVKP